MTNTTLILDRVRTHVSARPDSRAFVFIDRHDAPGKEISWRQLWDKASRLAQQLPVTTPAETCGVLIFCNDEEHFVVSLLAIWIRGAVAIPTSGSLNLHAVERNAHIIAVSCPDIILHDLPQQQATTLHAISKSSVMCNIQDCLNSTDNCYTQSSPQSGGLLQFTSGSTSSPRAILLDQNNLASNCAAITQAYSLDENSLGMHWLPLHHDMGLVGSVLTPLWSGVPSVILRPTIFIQRPIAWFQLISTWRASITSAPNFAYQRLVDSVTADDLQGLELSCLKNVIIGGEPVHKATLDRLLDMFGTQGLQADALAPSYGLAEATLLASTGKRSGGPVYSQRHTQRPIPALGPPVAGLTFSIINEHSGADCAAGELGSIQISGDCVGRPVPVSQSWREHDDTGPIMTGDYGYLLDGNIFVTGRHTNKIIVRGKNIYAEDVELLVSQACIHSQPDNVAAFGIEKDGTEVLCILIEQLRDHTDLDINAINQTIVATIGVKPTYIVALRRSTLPRTSSGKVRRSLARSQFLAGTYQTRTHAHVTQTSH